MLDLTKRFNLQLFAEDDPPADPPKDLPADPPGDPEPKKFDEVYVKKLRDEAAANRVKVRELESQVESLAQETTAKVLKALGLEPDPNKNYENQLAEAKQKAQVAEQRANERLVRAEVKSIATEMALVDADAALALMDKTNVKVADDGAVTGVKEALEALVATKPWLKQAQDPGKVGGGTNPPGGGGGSEVNPWKADTFNLTKQAELLRTNPALAAKLKAEAGVK